MSRKSAREASVCLLYAFTITGELDFDILQQTMEPTALDKEDMAYLENVTQGVVAHLSELDQKITEKARGWRIQRLGKVDLSILRLALYEMSHQQDVPVSVAINEAIELAKRYGDVKSGQFVNGILGAVSREEEQPLEGNPQ